jgi:hypothetical protein
MITSANEFIRLRTSELKEEYDRAASDEAPLDVWWELVRNHPDMKVWVVHNKTVPLEILDALSTDDDTAVRDAVARKRKASFEILERLAHDPDRGVRYAVACNKKTPPSILNMLLGDQWDVVVAKAKARLSEPD